MAQEIGSLVAPASPRNGRPHDPKPGESHELDPSSLSEHFQTLYRVARSLCASREDAEDLVQETYVQLLRRPRSLRSEDPRAYLIRALRNTHITHHRAAVARPRTVPLLEEEFEHRTSAPSPVAARELMAAISTAPKAYRDAVVAVDIVGLSYRQAAARLRTGEATIASRLHRGRRHVVQALGEAPPVSRGRRS